MSLQTRLPRDRPGWPGRQPTGDRDDHTSTVSGPRARSGLILQVAVAGLHRPHLRLPSSPLGRRLRRHRRAGIETLEHAGAHNPRVFASVARAEDTEVSDIDLLVDLDDDVSLVTLARLSRELAKLLGAEVDIVPADTLKPAVRARVLVEAIQL